MNSSGNAIIHDPDFDWTGEDFVMPPRNELVIYEMHVGSFNDSDGAGPGTFDEIVHTLPISDVDAQLLHQSGRANRFLKSRSVFWNAPKTNCGMCLAARKHCGRDR